ncbi:MAG: CaiB/BaiF CoA-transferase family protein [Deltaproteobacteria bacterium]|nr:CaiB/BaiF CoA-transferase family protein [Deltaproteobacteria bacterium]
MKRALEGIRVIDMSHVLAAPMTTMFLADLGAEVIHVEPPHGDDSREYGPFVGTPDKNHSGYFISLNRNKKSLVLNLKLEKGKEILRELIRNGDVLVENFRPSTMEKMGFGWEALQKLNPRLIYAAISGFGHDSPPEYAVRPSYDIVAQAYSGLMSITGPVGGPPCRVGTSVGDIISGQQAVIGILAALAYREKTGRGQFYDGSMVDGLFAILESAVARYTISGEIPGPLGGAHPSITPFEAFKTRDSWVIVAAGNNQLWAKLCRILNREDLIEDSRFASNHLRTQNQRQLSEILTGELIAKTTGEWIEIFEKQDIPYSRINNMKEICEDPIIGHRNMLVNVEQPHVGSVRIAGSPIHLSETPGRVEKPAPRLGEHSEEVLRTVLGYDSAKIAALKEEGVVIQEAASSGSR